MDEMVIKPAEGAREFKSFVEFEAAFDAEVRRVDVGFVRIGYYLRVAKDTNILQDSGYANMEEFAWKNTRSTNHRHPGLLISMSAFRKEDILTD